MITEVIPKEKHLITSYKMMNLTEIMDYPNNCMEKFGDQIQKSHIEFILKANPDEL